MPVIAAAHIVFDARTGTGHLPFTPLPRFFGDAKSNLSISDNAKLIIAN
jgi:hypothetical protein